MASVVGGPVAWRAEQDDDGFRTYRVTSRVKAGITESPAAVMLASGLPAIGSPFRITGFTGYDDWVWCRPEMSITVDQEKPGDPAAYYLVENVYSDKWEQGKSKRCNNTPVGDPLLEPMKVSGSFVRAQWEAKYDKDGVRLVTSANEPITGPGVTFDYVKPTVRIEQNVANLGLSTFASMVNTVNAYPLWGCPARCIKLANAPWERKVYGSCYFFYTRTFEFEVDVYNKDKNGSLIGHDREVYDSGSMCLRGQWMTDSTTADYGKYKILADQTSTDPATILADPQYYFQAYKDMNNEHTRVFLDGHGRPANAELISLAGTSLGTAGPPASAVCRYHGESNFLLLGVPTSF
jgi:hypothetical protein